MELVLESRISQKVTLNIITFIHSFKIIDFEVIRSSAVLGYISLGNASTLAHFPARTYHFMATHGEAQSFPIVPTSSRPSPIPVAVSVETAHFF